MPRENIEFKTEMKQLLDIMIHSLYSHKEIFLRELISNASDAVDHLRFESLKDRELVRGDENWKIQLVPDSDLNTLTIRDNGMGMSRDEMVEQLGTIAKSGTKEFLAALRQAKETAAAEMIGQFGVGFYSAFMVAEKVTVLSRKAGSDAAALWESSGDGQFSIEDAEKDARGTDVILKLKKDAKEFLEEFKIRGIVKKYSDYIEHPIELCPKEKKKDQKDETINSQKALWLRAKDDVKDEEYNEFYKHISHDWNPPAKRVHYQAEGTTEFRALLYFPSKAPFDLFYPERKNTGLHLYVNRVFITEDCKELMPEYLRFVKGVVDSSDLPLNVSREMLQHNPNITRIRKNLVAKVLNVLTEMKTKEGDAYLDFFKSFGMLIKEGIHADFENRDKLKDLLLYETARGEAGKMISLKDYVLHMPSDQKDIYYVTADSRSEAASSPHLEAFRSKGYDVLLMVDPIDEWVSMDMGDYDGKRLQSIVKGDVELDGSEGKKAKKEKTKKLQKLVQALAEKLGDQVKEVRVSNRLVDSSCCLVAGEGDMDARMERLMSAMHTEIPKAKRILEINPDHPLIQELGKIAQEDATSTILSEHAALLYEQALLTEGSKLTDPNAFAKKISTLMELQLKQQA